MSYCRYTRAGRVLAAVTALAVWSLGGLAAPTSVRADTSVDTSADAGDAEGGMDGGATEGSDTAGMDAVDGETEDVSRDATTDAETGGDGSAPTDGAETGSTDAEVGDTGADTDAAGDAGDGDGDAGDAGVDAGPRFRFVGIADVQFRTEESGVQVVLRRTDGEGRWERTTSRSGRFEIGGLVAGDYEIELSLSGYVTRADSFVLDSDRVVRYDLVRDQSAVLEVDAIFPEGAEAASSVEFSLEGDRGSRSPSEPVEVREGRASWTVETLPVGEWRIEARAEGWRPVSFRFAIAESRDDATPFAIRLFMRRTPDTPPSADTSGCGCSDRDGGSTAPRPGGPLGSPAVLLLFAFGVVGLRFSSRK